MYHKSEPRAVLTAVVIVDRLARHVRIRGLRASAPATK